MEKRSKKDDEERAILKGDKVTSFDRRKADQRLKVNKRINKRTMRKVDDIFLKYIPVLTRKAPVRAEIKFIVEHLKDADNMREWTKVSLNIPIIDKGGYQSKAPILPYEFVTGALRGPPLPPPSTNLIFTHKWGCRTQGSKVNCLSNPFPPSRGKEAQGIVDSIKK